MDYSIYRKLGQSQNTERAMVKKPRKHPYHCQRKWACTDYPECPKWHQTALRLTSIALILLVVAVLGLTTWISHLSAYSCSEMFGSENGTKECNCMNFSPRKQQDNTNFTSEWFYFTML
ncbi:hypothetical protein Cadr_000029300 [Camelus dromedarius]|uniref:Uncharacterized protein n=1 Tax=Camelus dromedarius TaxID=9838 RepID=A0A5N4C6P3_CAMDR|nr:hypothetical protein Cadr_000029300 [Camelus dromedarius]